MSASFSFYSDAALRHSITSLSLPLPTTAAVTRQIWLASRLTGRRLEPPEGQSAIQIILDGPAAASVRLSTSLSGLASATPGAALSLGAMVSGATPFYASIATDVGDEPINATLSLSAQEMGIG